MKHRTFNFWRILLWALAGLTVPAVIWAAVGGPVVTNGETGTAFPEKLGKNPAPGRVLQMPTGTDQRGAYWVDTSTGLPSGTPGQIPQIANTTGTYTYTATGTQTLMTGTQTTTTTEWKATNGTIDFDPMGTFYFDTCDSECAAVYPFRLGSLSRMQSYVGHAAGASPTTLTATCSTGSDTVFERSGSLVGGLISPSDSERKTTGKVWPGGTWMARLRAKVNANGAAIRVHVYEINSDTYAETEWFNFTSDVFTNTDFAAIEKLISQSQRIPSSSTNYIGFRFYATCSAETTVSLEFGDAALTTRIESPVTVDRLYTDDVWGLVGELGAKEGSLPYGYPGQALGYIGTGTDLTSTKGPIDVETEIPGGAPGRVVGYLGTGTATTTSKGPVDREIVVSGTPGQFVKFAGTGTETTTTKEGVTVSIPTPITTRSFFKQAVEFTIASGATVYNGSTYQGWLFADGSVQSASGAFFVVPKDASSNTLTVRPAWAARATDSSSHSVRWKVYYLVMTDGSSGGASMISVPFTSQSRAHTSGYYYLESGDAITASAGNIVKLSVERTGNDAADTFVGDVAFLGVLIDYTSSL